MNTLIRRDAAKVWHPFTQHKTALEPLIVQRAEGAALYTDDGTRYFDAISSWWVILHGHCHPKLVAALHKQAMQLDHVLFAGATHEGAVALAERLVALAPAPLSRVFFSDNGSTAVEVALKMALQYWQNRGQRRPKIVALRGAYHGDTFGAMAVSERGGFTAPFAAHLFDVLFIDAPLRTDPRGQSAAQLAALLELHKDVAAFIYEPLVQGAAGMRMQDAAELSACLALAKEHGVLCIADEVMTGFGRCGTIFASEQLSVKPDLMCVAKGLTGGMLPLSATLASEEIFNAFLSDDSSRAFFHGHSFTANPLGCAVAHAALDVLGEATTLAKIENIHHSHQHFAEYLRGSAVAKSFQDIRCQGTILACELRTAEHDGGYLSTLGPRMQRFFRDRRLLLRPLGSVVYVIPPYCAELADLKACYQAIEDFAGTFSKADHL